MKGVLITFEGTEGSGKSTQISLLAERIRTMGRMPWLLREPGGTLIGEEIRQTLKHSLDNVGMTAETELLMMSASRAQLVREVIRPALAAGEIVLCDRYYDSTFAYQAYGRELDLKTVQIIVDFAVGETRPDLTLFLDISPEVSEARRRSRQSVLPFLRDRMEEADRHFFERVAKGYQLIAAAEPERVKWIEATSDVPTVSDAIWKEVSPLLAR